MIKTLKNHLVNIPGWRTNRKIVVIESDDWGSIRMPNSIVYNNLSKKCSIIKNNPYYKYDTLASKKDLEELFEVLSSFIDKDGRNPIITANTVVANPDFKKIEQSNFQKYSYETFLDTLNRYYPQEDTWRTWTKGISEDLFFPQFHGREHVNVPMWLNLLQNNDPIAIKAFRLGCWAIPSIKEKKQGIIRNIQASYDVVSKEEEALACNAVEEGLSLFYKLFGFHSKSFIANNFIWSEAIEHTLSKNEVSAIQGMKYQKLPRLYSKNKRKMIRHYPGSFNDYNQIYLIRNCIFEPSQKDDSFDSVKSCLKDIENAFFWKKPAIITSHRLNFIGGLDSKNREQNLKLLKKFLSNILKKWPEVEFMSSVDLTNLIEDNS